MRGIEPVGLYSGPLPESVGWGFFIADLLGYKRLSNKVQSSILRIKKLLSYFEESDSFLFQNRGLPQRKVNSYLPVREKKGRYFPELLLVAGGPQTNSDVLGPVCIMRSRAEPCEAVL